MDDLCTSNDILLLDGGLSNELNDRVDFNIHGEPLWTAKALHSQPDAVIASHLAYLQAGADIIETASYQATLEGFKEFLSIDAKDSKKLISDSVALAKVAIKTFMDTDSAVGRKPPLIAGSIGPYGVYLRDGSEYTGSYMSTTTRDQLENMHLPRLLSLVDGGADLIAIETMPALEEVEVILNLLKQHSPNSKAWVSFSIKENDPSQTAFGDKIELAYNSILSSYPQVIGFGINCCKPTDITVFLKHLNGLKKRDDCPNKLKIIVYPNSGQQWIRGQGWIKEELPTLDSYVKEWIQLGANIIGGCCQVGVNQIGRMKTVINDWNFSTRNNR